MIFLMSSYLLYLLFALNCMPGILIGQVVVGVKKIGAKQSMDFRGKVRVGGLASPLKDEELSGRFKMPVNVDTAEVFSCLLGDISQIGGSEVLTGIRLYFLVYNYKNDTTQYFRYDANGDLNSNDEMEYNLLSQKPKEIDEFISINISKLVSIELPVHMEERIVLWRPFLGKIRTDKKN